MAIFTVYLHCLSRLFPSKHHMITVYKRLLPQENSQLVCCFFLCYFEALIQVSQEHVLMPTDH